MPEQAEALNSMMREGFERINQKLDSIKETLSDHKGRMDMSEQSHTQLSGTVNEMKAQLSDLILWRANQAGEQKTRSAYVAGAWGVILLVLGAGMTAYFTAKADASARAAAESSASKASDQSKAAVLDALRSYGAGFTPAPIPVPATPHP